MPSTEWTLASAQAWGRTDAYTVTSAKWAPRPAELEAHIGTADHLRRLDFGDAPAATLRIVASGSDIPKSGVTTTPSTTYVNVPARARHVVIDVAAGQQVGIQLLTNTEAIHIQVGAVADQPRPQLHLGVGRFGRLDVRECNVSLVASISPSQTSLSLSEPSVTRVEAEQAGLRMSRGNIGTLKLSGKCDVELGASHVNSLQVGAGAKVRIKATAVGRISLGENRRNKEAVSDLEGFTLRSGSRVSCGTLALLRATLDVDTSLRTTTASACAFTGPGELLIERDANDIVFQDPPPTLGAGQHAQLQRLSGRIRLSSAPHALLAGTATSHGVRAAIFRALGKRVDSLFAVDGIESEQEDALSGVSLINPAFPISRVGLRTISILDRNAATVEPALHSALPGRSKWALPPGSHDDPALSAEYARSLADLARSKGAAASTRTYLAACAYRMRQRTSGALERAVLRMYGLLGYGERPLPATATYGAVAALMAILSAWHHGYSFDPSSVGLVRYLEIVGTWLVTPLHVLRLTEPTEGSLQFEQPWDTLARVAVAIPFAVAILALRNYVKDDHRTRRG